MNYHDEHEMLELALEAGGMAWWRMELPTGTVFFSENKTRMLGRSKQDFYHYTDFTKLVHPDDYEPMMQAMQNHLDGKTTTYETTYRIRHADGTYLTFFDKGRVVSRKDGEIVIAGIVMSIDAHGQQAIARA
ncbi:MAG: PAS domain-containing protein [Candidatus Saccharimonadales bacterium]